MNNYANKGLDIRYQIKDLIFSYILNNPNCFSNSEGLSLTCIFIECGLDWGDYTNATSGQQKYYVVAALRELEKEGKIQRDNITKKWRLK